MSSNKRILRRLVMLVSASILLMIMIVVKSPTMNLGITAKELRNTTDDTLKNKPRQNERRLSIVASQHPDEFGAATVRAGATQLSSTRNDMGSLQIRNPCEVEGMHDIIVSGGAYNRLHQCKRIIFNKVPKCGSRANTQILWYLRRERNFTLHSVNHGPHFTNISELESYARTFKKLHEPYLYTRHIHYINFSRYDVVSPLYINVIRDPLSRLVSHYNYNFYGDKHQNRTVKENIMSFDRCVQLRHDRCMGVNTFLPFFCGYESFCQARDDNVLQIAKDTVSRQFLIVGLQEDLKSFWKTLEIVMPHFFAGSLKRLTKQERELHNRYRTLGNKQVSPETRTIMLKHLRHEYDLYFFVKQRFYELYSALNKDRR